MGLAAIARLSTLSDILQNNLLQHPSARIHENFLSIEQCLILDVDFTVFDP